MNGICNDKLLSLFNKHTPKDADIMNSMAPESETKKDPKIEQTLEKLKKRKLEMKEKKKENTKVEEVKKEISSSDSEDSDDTSSGSDSDEEHFISVPSVQLDWQNVPWIKEEIKTSNLNLQLHQEIIDFYNFLQPTKNEKEERAKTVERISEFVKGLDPNAKTHTFGSYATGLQLPGSDIDFCIERKIKNDYAFLERISKELVIQGISHQKDVEFIGTARVPIVRFVDSLTGQHGDISMARNGVNAVSVIQKYSSRYPAFKYLACVLKYFLKQRDMNEVIHGGMSSYSLLLLIINHLQMHDSNYEEGKVPTTSLGTLLLDFLALFGIYFNYLNVTIEINNGGRYRPKDYTSNVEQYDRPCIIDPTDEENNVAGGTRKYQNVMRAFKYAFYLLVHDKSKSLSPLSKIIQIDKDLVNRRKLIFGDKSFVAPPLDDMITTNERRREYFENKIKRRDRWLEKEKEEKKRLHKRDVRDQKRKEKKKKKKEKKERKKEKKNSHIKFEDDDVEDITNEVNQIHEIFEKYEKKRKVEEESIEEKPLKKVKRDKIQQEEIPKETKKKSVDKEVVKKSGKKKK